MFVVFTDQACTANIYNCEFNTHACMHVQKKALFHENKTFLSKGISAKIYNYIYSRLIFYK